MSHQQIQKKSSPKLLGFSRPKNPSSKCTPNILPCRIHHDGPVNASSRYWKPVRETDSTHTAYFRGRRLRGRQIKIPAGYEGLILKKTDRVIRPPPPPEDDQDDTDLVDENDDAEDCGIMDQVSSFDHITVWNHETVPDDLENPYVRGIKELIAFAGAIHSYDVGSDTSSKT